jgi:DNA-binding CsgD family transcriptional regulator
MRAVEHLKTLCCLGLPPESAIVAVTPLLHEIIPHRWTRFEVFALGKTHGGLSERSEKTSLSRERHIRALEEPGHAQVWIAQRQAGGIGWILHPQGRGCLDSPSYCEIEAPLNPRWALSAKISEGGRTYAALGLTRPRCAPPFKTDDVKRLHLLRPWLATALRPASPGPLTEGNEERPGIAGPSVLSGQLIVTVGGDIVHLTRSAEHLLVTLEGGTRRGPALPAPIKKLVERIVGVPHGSLCEPGPTRVSSPCGVHTIDAKWLISAGASPMEVAKDPTGQLIAVSIELHEHPIAHAARILRMSGATPAQVSAGIKLALGKTKPQIAHELSIRESSVADLTRKLYQTLDVHNSAELGDRIWLSAMQDSACGLMPGQTMTLPSSRGHLTADNP